MSKFLYPIYKLNIESYKKWWLYHKKAGGGTLSEILEGFSFNLENTLNRKFKLFEIEGNSVQDGSPSPDNEVPILSSGDNENLFDTSLLPITKNGVTISKDSKGNVVLNGTPTITSGYIGFDFTISSTYLKADTYTISVKNKINGIGISINQTTPGGMINLTMSDTAKVKTGTITADLINGTMGVNVRYDVGTLDNFILNPKLEKGNKATPYSPYGMGSINEKIKNADGTEEQDYPIFVQQPFRSIGDVRDCFVKKSDGWYERHYIARKIFDGTGYWTFSAAQAGHSRFDFRIADAVLGSITNNPIQSNRFRTNFAVEDNSIFLSGVEPTISIICDEFRTLDEFKTWLAEKYANGNPVYADYLLATPLDLPCTEEQIEALENKPSTYKDYTIIQSEDETPAYLKIQYYKEG